MRRGRVKLSICGSDGRTLILRIVEAGCPLGVAAVVSGRQYEATAETQEPSEISFLRQSDLLRLMRLHGELALWVTQHISQDYAATCREIRDLILSDSASEKLARLLVGWLDQNTEARNPSQMKLALTHEEIGQMIGTSRETVSRLFAGFKKQRSDPAERLYSGDPQSRCLGIPYHGVEERDVPTWPGLQADYHWKQLGSTPFLSRYRQPLLAARRGGLASRAR